MEGEHLRLLFSKHFSTDMVKKKRPGLQTVGQSNSSGIQNPREILRHHDIISESQTTTS